MKLQRSGRSAALLAAATLALTACSDADQAGPGDALEPAANGGVSGTIAGAGSSAQAAAMQVWIAGFQQQNPGVTINYDPVGSGGGREQFIAGGVDFAGSDRALDEEEIAAASQACNGASAINLPMYISPIAVAYNLPDVPDLQLSPETIARIFDQKITTWNDPAIAADNPDASLPDLRITPVNRSDDSGTTENFTEYLAAAAGEAWPHEPDGVFPVAGGEAAQGTSGVVQSIGAAEGAIGYADASQVGDLGIAAVQVGEEYVDYSPEAAAAVVENSPRVEGRDPADIALELNRETTESGNYPIVLVSYSLACTSYADAATGRLVKSFLGYVASEQGQQVAAQSAGSAPLSPALRSDVLSSIGTITTG